MILAIESMGGEEAKDVQVWLYTMYLKYCESKGIETKWIVKAPVGAGAPERESKIIGLDIDSGIFENEHGMHRVCRRSPFDSTNRRHTTFHYITIDGKEKSQEPVRSYVFSPYERIRNHYNDRETAEIKRVVMDGEMDLIL